MPTMPLSGRRRSLSSIPTRPRTLKDIRARLAAHKAMLKEIGAWRPDTVMPDFDNAMKDVAAAQPVADALEARLSQAGPLATLPGDEEVAFAAWESAVDRAHAIWAEQTRPTVSADEAARLLSLAKGARAIVDSAIRRAGDPQATPEDQAAAATVGRCSDQIVASGDTVDVLIARLQKAVDAGQGAHVTAPEVAAVEAFAGCAINLPPPKPRPTPGEGTSPVLKAVIGAGLPTAASVLIGLLKKKK
jgi:hypothetical protein